MDTLLRYSREFLMGCGIVLDIGGVHYDQTLSEMEHHAREAIFSDWQKTGQSIRHAMGQIQKEVPKGDLHLTVQL